MSSMTADRRGYYCSLCNKPVRDFRHLSREAVWQELSLAGEQVCGILPDHFNDDLPKKKLVKRPLLLVVISFFLLLFDPRQVFAQKQDSSFYCLETEEADSGKVMISGRVTGRESGQPLGFVSIRVRQRDSVIIQLETDIDGYYSADLSGKAAPGNIMLELAYLNSSFGINDIAVQSGKLTRVDVSMQCSQQVMIRYILGGIMRQNNAPEIGTEKIINSKEIGRTHY